MKHISKIIFGLFFLGLFSSCQNGLDMEKEQYKKVFYLLSNSSNIFTYSHSLDEDESIGYVTVYAGGTTKLDKDVTVTLEESDSLFNAYNRTNFDINYDKYAQLLPKSKYTIPSSQVTLKSDSQDPYVLFPIKVKANGLSPDSTYFINLKIQSVSDYEVNPKKDEVLYQVQIENQYASIANPSTYSMRGTQVRENYTDTTRINFGARLFPISKNEVRMIAGNNVTTSELENIQKYSIILVVNPDSTIDFKPFHSVQVEKVIDPNSNFFTHETISNVKYKVFYISYKYKHIQSYSGTTPNYSNWLMVNQRLALRVDENK